MCGIYGNLNFNSDNVNLVTSNEAVAMLRHRGPDEQGTWSNDKLFLGMRRLSIIDLESGQQPIWNEERTCGIVYNGELYNFRELRSRLESKGYIFRTSSDTEVVLRSYEEWGTHCLSYFNGMFAFAIWNEIDQTLFIARDRIGEKPLYYYKDNNKLVFSSEIKAILADRSISRDVSLCGVSNFFAFGHAVAPETIYKNISKLLPGHYLIAKDSSIQITQYWDVGQEQQISSNSNLTEAEYADRILELLDDSVQRRMIADVDVGAFLSGGVDSSVIVGLMKQHATGSIKTFSLGFTTGGEYNELSDAKKVAEYFGTKHHELRVEHVDLIQTLRKLVYHYDEPFGDAAGFPIYLLSQFASKQVKVVLTGDGGDELFGGYRRYAYDQYAPAYQKLPSGIANFCVPQIVNRLPRARRTKRLVNSYQITDPAERYASWLALFTPELQAELLSDNVLSAVDKHDPAWPYQHYYNNLNGSSVNDHLNRLMYIDLKTWLVDTYMEKTDKATMANSLEARIPLLDHRLVELAFQIPSRYKIRGLSLKRILKKAVTPIVPEFVLNKPKHGFSVPIDPWFRGDLKEYAFEVLFDHKSQQRGYFKSDFIQKIWAEHMSGRNVWDTHLWLLLNFELWHRIYIDGESI